VTKSRGIVYIHGVDDMRTIEQRIRTIADTLLLDSRARAVVVVDRHGQLVACAPEGDDLDLNPLIGPMTGNLPARGRFTRLPAQDGDGELEIWGWYDETERAYATRAARRRLSLLVLFDARTTEPLVRACIREACAQLDALSDELARDPSLRKYEEVTDEDLDDLLA
jgi:hypothetical protein